MNPKLNLLAAALGGWALAGSAVGAGFDCAKASTPVERMICADPALSAQDGRLVEIYRQLADRLAADPDALKSLGSDQRAWLRERRNRCTDGVCLAAAYQARIDDLEARWRGADPAAPDGARLDLPVGGWRNSQGEPVQYLQRVDYPASDVNLDPEQSEANRIKGRLPAQVKAAPEDREEPAMLIVNGIPMPLAVEEGTFDRPYLFGPGSNSVEVRSADRKSTARVQFFDAYRDRLQPRIRVFLSWDTDDTDLDLHVITPDGEHCDYTNRLLNNGGALDVDVTTGYGPEIFSTPNALPGTYLVYVNYYGGERPEDVTVASVTIVTDEGSADEKARSFSVPMRHPGEVQRITAFVYP